MLLRYQRENVSLEDENHRSMRDEDQNAVHQSDQMVLAAKTAMSKPAKLPCSPRSDGPLVLCSTDIPEDKGSHIVVTRFLSKRMPPSSQDNLSARKHNALITPAVFIEG